MIKMTCTRFEQLVQEVPQLEERDGILAAPSWQGHLVSCADCASAREDDQLLRAALSATRVPQPNPRLTDQILSAWSRECQETEQTITLAKTTGAAWSVLLSGARQRISLLAAGLAACALLMLQSPFTIPVFQTGAVATRESESTGDQMSLIASMRGLYQSVAQASRETAPSLAVPDVDTVLPEFSSSVMESDLAEATSQEMLKPIAELQDELHPLGEKVSRAVGFLWKTIPADESL